MSIIFLHGRAHLSIISSPLSALSCFGFVWGDRIYIQAECIKLQPREPFQKTINLVLATNREQGDYARYSRFDF